MIGKIPQIITESYIFLLYSYCVSCISNINRMFLLVKSGKFTMFSKFMLQFFLITEVFTLISFKT